MIKVELRHQQLSDAKRLYEILRNPNFVHFRASPKSLEDEKEFLKKNAEKLKNNTEHNFTILHNGTIVGGAGIKIRYHRKYIGEIGYFIDEKHWNKGIATQAVKILETIGFEELGLTRIEIWTDPGNKASQRVAEKCGYEKEGLLKKSLRGKQGTLDAFIYAKTFS